MSQIAVADAAASSRSARRPLALSLRKSRWTGYAWGAIAATVAFIAMTCWWLTQDRSIPIYDAGNHLDIAFRFRDMLHAGNFLGPFEYESVYPPLAHIVGALGALVGGVSVQAPIIANNLVFGSLLALGTYRTARLLFGSAAGMLAVIFVFGSPLLMELLHVFMLDPPMTALVAVSIWLLLASEDFRRTGVAAAAGVAVGAGMLIKVQLAMYVVGLVAVMLAFGGWRNWRGFAAFVLLACVVGGPWYIDHASLISSMLEVAKAHPTNTTVAVPPPAGNIPPTFSSANVLWYLWSILNLQLLAPLFLLAVGGTMWMAVTLGRSRSRGVESAPVASRPALVPDATPGPDARDFEARLRPTQRHLRLELMAGAFLTWLILTLTPHHDVRYGLPLLAYVAIVATGWITVLPRVPRYAAIAVLALGVGLNTLGVTFGVGHEKSLALASPPPSTQQIPDRVILYPSTGFLSAGPTSNGDIPGLFAELHRNGVRTVDWGLGESRLSNFSFEGLLALARVANLQPAITEEPQFVRTSTIATLVHQPITASSPPTCTRVKDISEVWVNRYETAVTGVWIVRWDPAARKLALYCPSRSPQYYSVGHV